ncbi:MAG: DNA-directed RNA polymerase subunit alpha C-terminal domain-containing protein [Planctomycetota bacterium]|nr:DNA-directed RNA polymerase subunit alpha C-terminal domain-containing protein [Planctomycetota bacterium]MEC8735171.1 DNA-directed RNA polymerase subunit alpha C-terminal domain-containing protein [Planctomycetota bacterium]MEC9157063.1 DNA-directed RNA polymerase subunit alpha C-terminal domain-containing protein [Planctomycetota bacterium]MEC9234545.1 DNA-directed RNA polymerase subunit alpha C-terminal domain-containing protein [Planctomycetota bacterium]MED5506558.1 DNA-directed RNA pol
MTNSGEGLDTVIGGSVKAADPEAASGCAARGAACEESGDRLGAISAYREAVELGAGPDVLFRLGWLLDQHGEEDESVACYERIVNSSSALPSLNAMVNLAIVYEDRGDIDAAERCLRKVLETAPDNPRARLFMKDIVASKNMYYDEEQDRNLAKRSALLDTPVTDFELSVRARNCLKKMKIRTLGDLLKITEAELLSYKNFGETSLVEIKTMLSQKGLRLGQGLEGRYSQVRKEIYDELRGKAPDHILNKPVSALELSVRARKALQQLGVQTIGDLASRTEAELMGVKNFGQTSLVEIREKLSQFNLDLRLLE